MVVVVRSRQHWDIKCPPAKKHMVAGKLVPTVRGIVRINRKKRIVLEVHGREDEDDSGEIPTVSPPSPELPTSTDEFGDEDFVVLRILKPRKHWGLSRDTEDSDSDDDDDDSDNESIVEDEGWIEYRKFDLDGIDEADKINRTTFEAKFGKGNHQEVREFRFPDKDALTSFDETLDRMRKIAKDLAEERAKKYQEQLKKSQTASTSSVKDTEKSTSEKPASTDRSAVEPGAAAPSGEDDTDDDVNLLVEIVSATDLPVADISSSDPYCVCWLGKTEVHRTKTISKTTDPIWTVDNGSLFILSSTSSDFFQSRTGLTILIKDYDSVGSNEVLGKVILSHSELLEARGERVECPLIDLYKGFDPAKAVHQPKLNIRVRPATKEDFKFIKTLHKVASKKKLGVYADEAFVAPANHAVNRLKRESKNGPDGVKLHRVKPGPDAERPEAETKWLSSETMEEEHMKPSTRWIETGSGQMGRLYLEILRCDGLPNMDHGLPGDKTDAFCSIIYEDAIANTDVINDELSPRWMPWSQRAFVFRMEHPSSQILIGVFDWDSVGKNDPIGRISIDITNFYEKTDYVMTFDLFESVLDEERPKRGTLTVRLRTEIGGFRNVVQAALQPPPARFVNVTKKDDFLSSRFVTCGEENLYKLDMDALKSYGIELQSYADVLYYIQQAAMTVVLWRGHYDVNIFGWKTKLPLHSIAAFVMAVLLVENYNLFPSFFFFSIGWLFLATNEQRQRNPSPWCQTATFMELWKALIFGSRTTKNVVEVDAELKPLIAQYETAIADRHKKQEEDAKKTTEHGSLMDSYFAQEELEAANEEAGGANVETTTGGMQLNPLKPILLPIQQILGQVAVGLRVGKSLVTWEESVYAFLLTNACFIVGVVLLIVPWGFLIRWTLRIVVWVLFGPWMKLVDIYVVRKLEEDGDNLVKVLESNMQQRSQLLMMRKRNIMIIKEDAQKLRAMKRYMFGKYVARVPQFKEYRYRDIPLASSKATPHDDSVYSSVKIVERKHGQGLTGNMIPSWGNPDENVIMTAKAAEK